jgi:predicted DNA-binding transcriptional regulator AlpA
LGVRSVLFSVFDAERHYTTADWHLGLRAAGALSSSLWEAFHMNLLSLEQVVDLTGLSRSSLAKKRCDGSGPPYFKIGRAVKYDQADVQSWILSRRRTCTWPSTKDNAAAKAA